MLIGLVGFSPALLFFSSPITAGVLVAYAAVAVAVIGFSIRPGEAGYLTRTARPLFLCTLVPAIWMLIQILPLPMSNLVHPIWISAQAALDNSIWGSISIDRGSAVMAFISYAFAASVIFISAAVTIDRSRAEDLLFWLTFITTFAAVIFVVLQLGVVNTLVPDEFMMPADSWIALTGLGAILNATASIRAIERYETRRSSQNASFNQFFFRLIAYVAAAAFCAISIIAFAGTPMVFAMVFGLAAFGAVVIIRRLGLGPWVNIVFALTIIVVGLTIIMTNWQSGDLAIRFASNSSQASNQVIQSMLIDTRWMGNGAGSFGALLPIYQTIDNSIAGPYAPTAAATISIELGRPALYVILTIAIILLVQLLRGALKRGRDSFYPAAGASSIVLLTLEAFCDSALLEKSATIIACSIIGVALAQSVSRTNQTG